MKRKEIMENEKLRRIKNESSTIRSGTELLYRQIVGMAKNFVNQIKVLNAINNRHFNSNADKAAALYKEVYLKAPSGIRYHSLLSELEIRTLLNKKDFVKELSGKLAGILWKVKELDRKTFKWQLRIQNATTCFRLYKQIQDKTQQQSYQNLAKASLKDMKEAKEAMNNVMRLMKSLNSGNPFPIVRDVIDFYVDFFISTDKIFNQVERYVTTIIDLTEEVLGPKCKWANDWNEPHSKKTMDLWDKKANNPFFEIERAELKRH